ncbi:long-chain-fatty-acid--CoA ligase heimdall-like, partial [Musca vetustissima]|uniref:long-chain-fatty-acid--CoA ligase heimdall-like n=1 Tax=Musca vetustissima TaxID=27455 RepID=UPI002AB6E9A6
SGTVGMPKGVMISHDAVLYAVQALNKNLPFLEPGRESCITYLPLSHIASQFFDIFLGMLNGAVVYFADRNAMKGTLCETLVEVRPTWFFGVPRIFEKLIERQRKLEANLEDEGQRKAFKEARRSMLKYYVDQMGAGNHRLVSPPGWASEVCHEQKVALGLNTLKICFAGGAPVSDDIKRYFLSLDLPLVEAFGMSETCGGVCYDFQRPNLHTSGQGIGDAEFKIHEPDREGEGEILIRGRFNFMGYLKEPQKTKEAFTEDGYIRSGDRGHLDAAGNLYINGRIKEVIITSGGENISPIPIEDIIKKELPCISNAMVIGDNRKYLTVLLTMKTYINPDTGYPTNILLPEAIQWLITLGVHCKKLDDILNIQLPESFENFQPNGAEVRLDSRVFHGLTDGINRYNERALSNAQKIQYFQVLPHDFTIATGEL